MNLSGANVFVSGATGTFGHAFTPIALAQDVRRLVVFSRDELKQSQMAAQFPDPRMRFFLGDIRDGARLASAMRDIDVVIHAAALKQVPACAQHPWEAVQTNIDGTYHVLQAAIQANVQQGIFLSTDKAAAPSTFYGATKLCAEGLWLHGNVYAGGRRTRFSATRYGNVLGSRGSIGQVFAEQAKIGPVQLTHPDATRFWMTSEEAVQLVLLALREMRGGETFIPKLRGKTVQSFIPPDASVMVTGLRAGEKIHETLITPDEVSRSYDCGDHYRIEPISRSWEDRPWQAPGILVPSDFRYMSG
jgi:UDP-N-acetylglucosamine 4,6-dehydratase